MVWTAFFAWAAGIKLPLTVPVAMFVAVWILYAADRLLDARPLRGSVSPLDLEARHHFHDRRRTLFALLLAIAVPLLGCLLTALPREVLAAEASLALAVGLWMAIVHLRRGGSQQDPRPLPKEFVVGLVFGIAAVLPAMVSTSSAREPLLLSALLFCGVCTANCLFLYRWEDRPGSNSSHPITRWAGERVKALSLLLMVLATALAFRLQESHWTAEHLPGGTTTHLWTLPLACTASLASLLWLHQRRDRFSKTTVRALADVALLSPLLFAGMGSSGVHMPVARRGNRAHPASPQGTNPLETANLLIRNERFVRSISPRT